MKLSNNAIKFLMAQYRAIYKNAYFKGIASAVVLTSVMAAGAAQAAPDATPGEQEKFEGLGAAISDAGGFANLSGNKIANDTKTLKLSGTEGATNTNTFVLQITSGDHHIVTKAGSGASVTAEKGTLQLNGENASFALKTAVQNKSATLNIHALDVKKGTVKLVGSGGDTTAALSAKTVTVGGVSEAKGTVELSKASVLGKKITAGDLSNLTSITIMNGGSIGTAKPNTANVDEVEINAGQLIISGGNLSLLTKVDSGGNKTSSATLNLVKGQMTDGAITVESGSTLNLNFADGNFTDGSGSVAKVFDVQGGTMEIKGATTISGAGTVKIGDGATVTGDAAKAAALNFSGTSTDNLVVELSKDKLIEVAAGTATTVKSATISLTDSSLVDLADITFSGNAAATKIKADTGSILTALNLQVGKKVDNIGSLSLKANNLTLGSSTYDGANALGFSGATAKNLYLEGTNGIMKLKDTVTLSNINDDKVAQSGTISGSFELAADGKTLSITGGKYSTGSEDTIRMGSGDLTVKATDGASEASLKINGNLFMMTGSDMDGKITVEGSSSKLDLLTAQIVTSGDGQTSGSSIIAKDKSQVLITGSGLEDLFTKPDASEPKAGMLQISGGASVLVTGDVSLDAASIAKTQTHLGIQLTAGTVDVQGALTLSGKEVDLGATASGNSIVKAQTLDIQVGNAATDNATLKSGDFVVTNGLSTNSTKGFVLGNTGLLQLGDISADKVAEGAKQTYTSVGGGSITGAVDINSGSFNVLAGSWNAGKITMTSGDFTIGQDDKKTIKYDAADQAITASLKAKELSVAASKTVTVNKYGTLTSDNTKVSGSISVSGQLNLKTEYTAAVDSTPASYGLALGDDAIQIKEGGLAVLAGDGAFTALGIKEGKAVKASEITGAKTTHTGAFHDSGSFKDAAGATLKLDLAEGTSFDSAALTALQTRLYGSGSGSVLGTIDIGAATISDIAPDANNEVKWEDLGAGVHKVMPNYKSDELKGAVLVAKEGTTVAGHVGSIKVDTADDMATASVNNKVSLNKADSNGNLVSNKNGAVLGLKADQNSYVELDAAGKIGALTLGAGSTVDVGAQNGAVNVMGNINGKTANLVNGGNITVAGTANIGKLTTAEGSSLDIAKDLTVNETNLTTVVNGTLNVAGKADFKGETDIQGNTTVGTFSVEKALTSTEGSVLKVTSGAFTAKDTVNAKGSIQVASGDTTFTKKATLAGADNQFKTVSFKDEANFAKGVTKADKITLETASKPLNVTAGGTLVAGELTAQGNGTVIKAGTFGNKEAKLPSSTGYLSVGTLNLNGGELVADPEFGTSAASVIAVKQLGTGADLTNYKAGTLKGSAYALQNSIIALGTDNIAGVQSTFAQYFDNVGSLKKDDVGAVAYLAEEIKVADGSKIVVDATANDDATSGSATGYKKNAKTTAYDGADLYLGSNSALAVDLNAIMWRENTKSSAAVTFDKNAAVVKTADKSARVIINAEGVQAVSEIDLFDANTSSGSVTLSGSDLLVETSNGLFSAILKANSDIGQSFHMTFNTSEAKKAFANVSEPVRDTIITYAYGAHNPQALAHVASPDAKPQDPQILVGEMYGQFIYDKENGKLSLRGADGKADTTKDQAAVDAALNEAGLRDAKTGETHYTHDFNGNVYREAENKFLAHVLSSLNGVDAETAARLADFGGVAQAALRAGNTTSDAIAARMGVGVNGTVTFAANGQGSGMWVTPVYKTADSDSFGADSVDYGTDMNLYGVAVGADVSVMENVSAGVMFNVGSGDADGQGLGSNVKNDFDYYGFGAYMGYTMGAASVVADVSWTTVDNSVEGQTGLGTLAASIDSSALSLGVTGKYAMDFGGVNVTPHAGLRFTRIDQDDYSVGNGTDVFAQYSSNSMNVFSVPVGVTVEKEYTFDAWSVKPAFDLTLTGNFGDDETSGTVDWEGISNLSTDIKSEFVDTFTYSTAIGVAAQTGNFGMGLGVNYTGASNVKEFGVNANVRYVF